MKRIKLLSDIVKKKIAAGEVIEGPFSVIKELIENSIDSGAKEIDIQVADSGLKRIVVRDDGSGIYRDDIKLAIAEHATSKIEDIYDIEKISSYGFRGEALSSISSVSELTILSRADGEETGGRLASTSGGVTFSDYAGPHGTTVIVENLFYNIPARKKFLKSRRTELRFIRETFLNLAMAVPEISLSLEVEGKRHITLPAAESLMERVRQIYGREHAEGLYFERLQDIKVRIYGFLSKPAFMKSSRAMQILFINKRPIEYKYMGYILSKGYEGIAIKGKYPAALIFIDIDPELIDINIHPAKREVKIFDQKYIDGLIFQLIGKALNKKHAIGPGLFKADTAERAGSHGLNCEHQFNQPDEKDGGIPGDGNDITLFHGGESIVKDMTKLYNRLGNERADDDCAIIGVAFGSYIIVEKDYNLELIDFHAAHERLNYNLLMMSDNTIESQALIFPVMMELPVDDYRLILDHRNEFNEFGFDIDDFSDNTLMVRAVPLISKNADVKAMIGNFIESIRDGDEKSGAVREKIAASVACHSAKRSGERLTYEEMRHIVFETSSSDFETRCPHGRPFVYKIGKNDLERIFKRQ